MERITQSLVAIFFTFFLVVGAYASGVATEMLRGGLLNSAQLPAATLFPSLALQKTPELKAQAAIVFDPTNGRILFAKNIHEQLPLASITKLMTAEIVLTAESPDTLITITPSALAPEGEWGFRLGDTIPLHDLLKMGLIASSNDATQAAALSLGPHYIETMNHVAQNLGLQETTFVNPTGLDVDEYTSGANSSAYDVARLAALFYAQYPNYFELTQSDSVSITYGGHTLSAHATALPLLSTAGFKGAKTGYTTLAGGNVVAIVDIEIGHPAVVVVLGSTKEGRFADIETLVAAIRQKNNMTITLDAMRIFIPATISFLIGIGMTPFLTHFLYKHKMWKPTSGKMAFDGTPAETFNRLHQTREVGTPRFGGVIVWGSVVLTAGLLSTLSLMLGDVFNQLAFISRSQTWVPLGALLVGAAVGFFDDLYEVQGKRGLRLRVRLSFVAGTAFLCACWFFIKLGVSSVSVPFGTSTLELGIFFIPFFVLVAMFVYAGGVIDGIDGLAGGVFCSIFAAYAGIAFFQNQMDIAALCTAVFGGLLAFLWFNIPPARFYLSETGTMGLTLLLVVVAFATDVLGRGHGVGVLPIIALPLVATVLSNILQIIGKKFFGKKILLIAPLHHHFEALGWAPYKVTMRYWIVGVLAAIIGMTLALV